jgi:hypothetical protein
MGERRNVTTPGICSCLQGAGDSRDQTGEAYWSYVSQVVCGEPWCPLSSNTLRAEDITILPRFGKAPYG